MTFTVKLAIGFAAVFVLALGLLFAFAGDPPSDADAADKPEPQAQAAPVQAAQPQPQAQVAPPVKVNPVNPTAAYMNQVRPLLEKSRIKLLQISNTYESLRPALTGPNAAVADRFKKDAAELGATYAEIRALTPPDCLERTHKLYAQAAQQIEIGLGMFDSALRFNHASDFQIADAQLTTGAKTMQRATAELNAAAC